MNHKIATPKMKKTLPKNPLRSQELELARELDVYAADVVSNSAPD